ncbi:MAG TPA: hypothetical protein VGG82_03240 [Casimicrobiaceae bacterium]|jgi:hypothetical protein
MKGRARTLAHIALIAAAVIALIIGHGFFLYYAASLVALSAVGVFGIVVLLVLKHLGMLGALVKSGARGGKTSSKSRRDS